MLTLRNGCVSLILPSSSTVTDERYIIVDTGRDTRRELRGVEGWRCVQQFEADGEEENGEAVAVIPLLKEGISGMRVYATLDLRGFR
jgi:hypothetical protein